MLGDCREKSIAAFAVVRFGLVTLAAGLLTANLLLSVPVTASPSSGYAGSTAFVFASVRARSGVSTPRSPASGCGGPMSSNSRAGLLPGGELRVLGRGVPA